MNIVAALLWLATPAQIELPGTQPEELTLDLRPPSLCDNCHGEYDEASASDTWAGTMMANAARDPLFHAALAVANQDAPGSGDICIRCHSPRAWLFGRSDPPDLSALEPDDFESVQCDFCHRLERERDGMQFIGNGQYFVADDFVRRGTLKDPAAPHDAAYSDFFADASLCGLCHDVSNPLEDGFAIERTYTEWLSSAFPAEGETCQRCHMPEASGLACGAPDAAQRTIHRHDLAGGNTWMPRVLAGEYPELGREAAFARTVDNARAMLERAAEISIEAPDEVTAGDEIALVVRVENLTGHKLPTGYPEGRRSWLEVTVTDGDGEVVLHSGAYDADTALRLDDAQLRTYEVRMAADGEEGFHFMRQDELLQDNRIPPRGFVPAPDTRPVGRDYPEQDDGTLAWWDEAPYSAEVPRRLPKGELTIEATLWYQTTSREYVEFLRDENRTDDSGERVLALWEDYDRAPPEEMATASATVLLEAAPDRGGCATSGAGGSAPAALLIVLWLLLTDQRRRRHETHGLPCPDLRVRAARLRR
jgi:hypothetical protein